MFNLSYPTNTDFLKGTANHPNLFKTAYARNGDGVAYHAYCWRFPGSGEIKSTILASLPILGTILGIAHLHSIYAVKDRSNDRTRDIVAHTIAGILETLGLGILLLVVKIIITTTLWIILGNRRLF
ncbi:hypothetical protein O1W69_05085 [Chlamydia sp. 12-01]|uniref:hypothetical protein n=1 Tax=Chlamydia sp. 12-01 TaxID=3002742 RepID=UPI0035D49DEE